MSRFFMDVLSEVSDNIPFKVDSDLEGHYLTTGQVSLELFLRKGGTFQKASTEKSIKLLPNDSVYPICSGGFCRSQTLWAILRAFKNTIDLVPPHAARHGWDPYNGKINRYRNYTQEALPDQFENYFGIKKADRFGFENTLLWNSFKDNPTLCNIEKISSFYSQYYFANTKNKENTKRRVFIPFSNNTHVVLHRLNQANTCLKDVFIFSIDSPDIITRPPEFLETFSRSEKAYDNFAKYLQSILDIKSLDR